MPKTPISYYGGKINMLKHILPLIPDHNIYTEAFFGGGAVFMSDNVSLGFSAPFGLGFKVSPLKRVGINLFWSARKTFSDLIDNVESIDYKGYNGDWYVFYGLNITFAFRLKKDTSCRNLINGRYY